MKRIAILTAAITLALAGCATEGAPVTGTPRAAPGEPAGEPTATTGEPTAGADGGEGGTGDGSFTGDDLGTGTVFLGSVMYEGFRGSCTFTSTDMDTPSYEQQLQGEKILVAVGVDNLDSSADEKINVKVLSTSSFSVDGAVSGKGALDAIAASAGFTEVGAGVITEVVFNGSLEDGTPMMASLVCLLQ